MKKFNFLYLRSFLAIASLLLIGFFTSCSDDDSGASTTTTITSVNTAMHTPDDGSPVEIDVPTEMGLPNNTYFIHGTGFSTLQKIYFNGVESYFNPTMVTDDVIVVTIDQDTPYENASSELKIVTKFGTVIYPFVIAPPAPVLTKGFNPVNAADGSVVTIYGDFFLDPVVTFGTIPATIISATMTEIKVTVPVGSDKKFISVKTISGTVTSVEAVGTALYDDELYGMQWGGPWAGKGVNFDYNGDSYQGEKSWQWIFGGWDGGNWGFNIDMTPYKSFRIAVKGKKNGQVNFSLNGGSNYVIPVTTAWVYMEIPLSNLGNPTAVTMITFQESNNDGGNTVLFDDLGFVLK
jgi:hypothetical protein